MKNKPKKTKQKGKSVQDLMGIKTFTKNGLKVGKEELIFYIGLWGILHEKEIESLHTGSTGQTELPRDRVKMLKLLLPDNISLSRFNSIIAPMASTIILNQEENQKLASLRDTLLPKLMSGEIDVSSIQL